MPTYDYACDNKLTCGHEFELTHPIGACSNDYYCDVCGNPAHRVLRSAPTAVFLGPGFACNDGVAKPNIGRNPNNGNRYSK